MKLADIVASHPEFRVNLTQHVLASRHVHALERRLDAFRRMQSTASPWTHAEREVMVALRDHLVHEISAYGGLAGSQLLTDLPMMDKQTLRDRPMDYVAPRVEATQMPLTNETSGTTGRPVRIFYEPEFYFDFLFLTVRKITNLAGVEPDGARPLFSLSLTDNEKAGEWIIADPCAAERLGVQVVIDERCDATIERFWRLVAALRPAVIAVKPNLVEVLVHHAKRTNSCAPCPPDLVVSSGALLSEPLRESAQALFGAQVVNAYGMTEFGLMAAECSWRDGLHLDESSLAVEQIGAELVASSVSNRAMPLLRYRTADLGELVQEPCRCGRTTARIRRLSGRRVTSFLLPSEELVSPARFNHLFARPAVREFQMTQTAPLRFELAVELERAANVAEVLPLIEHDARMIFRREVNLDVHITSFDRDAKFERYRCAF